MLQYLHQYCFLDIQYLHGLANYQQSIQRQLTRSSWLAREESVRWGNVGKDL